MKAPKCPNVNKVKIFSVQQPFADTLDERLEPTTLDTHDVDAVLDTLREAVYDTATECLVSEIKQLLEEKHRAYKAHVNDPNSRAKSDALRSIRSTIEPETALDAGLLAQ